MPKSRAGGMASFRNTLARRAATTGTPAEISAVFAAEVKTSARVLQPVDRESRQPKSTKWVEGEPETEAARSRRQEDQKTETERSTVTVKGPALGTLGDDERRAPMVLVTTREGPPGDDANRQGAPRIAPSSPVRAYKARNSSKVPPLSIHRSESWKEFCELPLSSLEVPPSRH